MSRERDTLETLFSATYEELRRLASSVSRNHPGETLNPTALVNEAYLKLARSFRTRPESRLHFKRIAARAMRQVLVEAARRRRARKRGGDRILVTLEEGLAGEGGSGEQILARGDASAEEMLALDAALEELARLNPRQARLVEYRFFGGLEVAEAASLLDVSPSTAERDWRAARAWLAVRLR